MCVAPRAQRSTKVPPWSTHLLTSRSKGPWALYRSQPHRMPKAVKETKPRPKTFEDVFVAKPEHDHCKQILASKRIRDCCFTGWETSREPYFTEDKGCYALFGIQCL